MQIGRVDPDIQPTKSDASQPALRADGSATLASSSTYYYPLGGEDAEFQSIHLKWDASIILTSVEVEDSNFDDASLVSSTAGDWVKSNPATGIWDVFATATSGATITASSIAVSGGNAGGAFYNRRHACGKRSRLKVVVAGTGGVLRVAVHGKS